MHRPWNFVSSPREAVWNIRRGFLPTILLTSSSMDSAIPTCGRASHSAQPQGQELASDQQSSLELRRRVRGRANLSKASRVDCIAGRGAFLYPSRFSDEPGLLIPRINGPPRTATIASRSPESGSAVSWVVENLSRKIHIRTTKSWNRVSVSVYSWWCVCRAVAQPFVCACSRIGVASPPHPRRLPSRRLWPRPRPSALKNSALYRCDAPSPVAAGSVRASGGMCRLTLPLPLPFPQSQI
jgi:hypothetical protein